MRFVNFSKGQGPQQMWIDSTEKPTAKDHQVLLEVKCFGVNRADTLQRLGKYPPPAGESEILGLEVAGIVHEVGEGVSDWKIGDTVFGLVAGGGYAEYVAVNSSHLMKKPERVSFSQAAGIAEVFLTAFQSLQMLGKLIAGQKVLIHAGASGVGLAAIQLANALACQVAVTASSKVKLDKCHELGAEILIDYNQQDFAQELKNQSFFADVIIDFVGGDYLNRNLSVLALDGKIIYLAMLAGRYADKLDLGLMLAKRARLIGSTLRNRSDDYKTDLIAKFANQWLTSFEDGRLIPNIDEVFCVNDIAGAHQKLELNQTMGKLIGQWN